MYRIDSETHEYSLVCTDNSGASKILAIDWTADSTYIRKSTGDYETLYFDVANNQVDPHGSETYADKIWASNSVKMSPDRRSLNPKGVDGTHINDNNQTTNGCQMITGDDFGLVNVFNWPNPNCDQARSFAGHSEHVIRVLPSKDGKRLYSIGGQDKTII